MARRRRIIQVRLRKDLLRDIKRGHAWLYNHAIDSFSAPAGAVVEIWDRKGEKCIATGIADPEHPIPVRVCRTDEPYTLDKAWLARQLTKATGLRKQAFSSETTGYRLIAGEGDGLPGLIVDRYADMAVMKVDGGAPEAFYDTQWLAKWLVENTKIVDVVLRSRERGRAGELLEGDLKGEPEGGGTVEFLENGMRFTADVLRGQKTGFFLDQRDNRNFIRGLSHGRSVLNLFSFNGGFSIAAGLGGATQVTSVDLAGPAIEGAKAHWRANNLDEAKHEAIAGDCFEFLEEAIRQKRQWDIVICDPPSFAPSERARPQAIAAYTRLTQLASRVTAEGGLLAPASCSSHIDPASFRQIQWEALGKSRRKATLLAEKGLPIDHPTPLAMPELRYLKFMLLQLD